MAKYTPSQKKTIMGLIHQIVEARDKKCLRCGKPDFQLSHVYPKGRYKSMEYDPDNIKALCFSCHLGWWHKNPLEAAEWIKTVIPKVRLDRLKLMSQTAHGIPDFNIQKLYLQSIIKKLKN